MGMTLLDPLNAELNPICDQLALLGAHHIFHVSGLRVKNGEKMFINAIQQPCGCWFHHMNG